MGHYDASTGQVVDTPAHAGIVSILAPNGQWDAVPAARVKAMLDIGYQLDTPDLRAQLEQRAKFGDRPAAAALAGAGRGLTFGLSDLALDTSGLVDSETLKGLEEENPGASTVGELGALAIPGLGSLKALGTVGKLAKGLGAGVEAATAIGKGVEGVAAAIPEALGVTGASTAGRIAGTYLPRAAGIAAEGELYNIGHNLSQGVLHDEDLTAESLLAHSDNALALGASLGLGSPALRRAGRELFDRAVPDIVKTTAAAALSKAAKGAADQVTKFFDPDRSLQLFAGAGQKELRQDTGGGFQRAVRALREKGFFRSGDVAADIETGGFKRLGEGELPSQEGALSRLTKAQDDIGQAVRSTLQEVDSAIGSDALKLGKDGAWEVGTPLEAKRIYKFQRDFKAAVSDIAPAKLKEIRKRVGDMEGNGIVSPAQAEELIGKRGGNGQYTGGLINEVRSLVAGKRGSLSGLQDLKLGLSERIKKTGFEKPGAPEIEILKDLRRAVKENIEYGVELVKNEQRYKGLANKVAGVGKLNETWGQLESIKMPLDRAIARSEANVNVGGLRWRDMLAGVGGSSVGGAVAGPVGAVAGAGLGIVNKALQTDRGLLLRAAIGEQFASLLGANRAMGNVRGRLVDGAREFVTRKALPSAERTVRELGPRTAASGAFLLEDRAVADNARHDKQERYRIQLEQLGQLVHNPDVAADKLAAGIVGLEHVSPGVRDKVVAKKLQAYGHLYDKAPKDPLAPFLMNPTQSKYRPSDGDLQRWQRHWRAAAEPLSIVDDLKSGEVTPEAVETTRTLYPRIYATLQDEIANQVAQAEEPMPYNDRVQLGLLFDVPTDPSLTPDFMQAMLEQPEQPGVGEQGPAGGARVAGASRMSGEGLETRSEALV